MKTDQQKKSAIPDHLRDALLQYSRNGRWGTCGYCPRDADGRAYPEFCEHTERYDHQLDIGTLAHQLGYEDPAEPKRVPLWKVGFTFAEYSFYRFVRAASSGEAIQACKSTIDFEINSGSYTTSTEIIDDRQGLVLKS